MEKMDDHRSFRTWNVKKKKQPASTSMIFSEAVLHVSTWQALFPKESKIRIPWWRNEKNWEIMRRNPARKPVEVGSLSHDFQGFIHPRLGNLFP